MSVDEASDKKQSPIEIVPQEDGTKVLIKDETDGVAVQQAKFSNPNGETKINIGSPQSGFAGLTKEELMKYSTDPFWVRLRWILFILFWVGWVAMLVMAIVIIIQAPGCEPPPVLLWVEESPLIQVDPANVLPSDELVKKTEEIGVSSVYFPDILQEENFKLPTIDVESHLTALTENKKKGVTDLPMRILPSNPVFANATKLGILLDDGTFDYSINETVAAFVAENIINPWMKKGMKGFLMENANTPDKIRFKEEINVLIEGEGGAVGSDVKDLMIQNSFTVSKFEDFLEEHAGNWTFYKYKPSYEASSRVTRDQLRLVTFGLYLFEGTPVLVDPFPMENTTAALVKELSELRKLDGIKFGETNFANSSETSLGFTRAYKGTPAYAVALNFDEAEEVISFAGTPNIAEEGTIELLSTADGSVSTSLKTKVDLGNVKLGPKEGVAIQFVANFG